MRHAICDREFRIRAAAGAVHWLQKEMLETQRKKLIRIKCRLRVYKFQFVSAALHQRSVGFGAYADPIQTCRGGNGSIGLDCNFEVARMQRCNDRRIDLE